MGADASRPLIEKQKFRITTQAILVDMNGKPVGGPEDKQSAQKYLESPRFKKRALFDLNSNFMLKKDIKITISSIQVSKSLKVILTGTIHVLNPGAEDAAAVKSVLKEALPQYSAQGEQMPKRGAPYYINFAWDKTSLSFV